MLKRAVLQACTQLKNLILHISKQFHPGRYPSAQLLFNTEILSPDPFFLLNPFLRHLMKQIN